MYKANLTIFALTAIDIQYKCKIRKIKVTTNNWSLREMAANIAKQKGRVFTRNNKKNILKLLDHGSKLSNGPHGGNADEDLIYSISEIYSS